MTLNRTTKKGTPCLSWSSVNRLVVAPKSIPLLLYYIRTFRKCYRSSARRCRPSVCVLFRPRERHNFNLRILNCCQILGIRPSRSRPIWSWHRRRMYRGGLLQQPSSHTHTMSRHWSHAVCTTARVDCEESRMGHAMTREQSFDNESNI